MAHDGKKPVVVNLINKNIEKLKTAKLIVTGSSGTHVENRGLSVEKKLSGPVGGAAQIAALAAEKELSMLFF
jgi:methylglyoxal synthase